MEWSLITIFMTKDKFFRECISTNNNELVINAADNFPQFPQRDSSVASKCDRTLAAANSNDLDFLLTILIKLLSNVIRITLAFE
jgi:hypothetical protein